MNLSSVEVLKVVGLRLRTPD